MSNYKLTFLIIKNKAKLDHLITIGADYSKISKQSKKVDLLINRVMKEQLEETEIVSN